MRPDPPFWSDCDGGFLVFVVVHNWQFCRGLGARRGAALYATGEAGGTLFPGSCPGPRWPTYGAAAGAI